MGEEHNVMDFLPENCQTAYFNGFSLAIGVGDVVISLQQNGKPALVLNTSYTVAKSLGLGLQAVISELEKKTGVDIMTTDTVAKALLERNEPEVP